MNSRCWTFFWNWHTNGDCLRAVEEVNWRAARATEKRAAILGVYCVRCGSGERLCWPAALTGLELSAYCDMTPRRLALVRFQQSLAVGHRPRIRESSIYPDTRRTECPPAKMLYEMIGVVGCFSRRCDRDANARRCAPAASPKLKSKPLPPLKRLFHSHASQNRQNCRPNRPREERSRTRRDQLGYLSFAQARKEAADHPQRRPPLHHALRRQRTHTAFPATHNEFGSAVDTVLDREDGHQV